MPPTPKKAYCFTLNNYTEDEYSSLCRTLEAESRYAIVGKEVGESGTPHIQGYVIFHRAYRFSTIKSRYLPRCHIEVAAGSVRSNINYCSKDGNFRVFGEEPREGGSNRDEIAQSFRHAVLESGRHGLCNFAVEQPGTWYYSGHNLLRNYMTLAVAIDRPEIKVLWLFGEPGVGKSRRAHETYPEAYVKEPRTKWWNGYMLEKDVIIDDFGPGGIDINHLLRWFDRYKCYVENKGGMLPLHAVNFVVTSNFHPRDVFKFADVINPQYPALERRITIEEM